MSFVAEWHEAHVEENCNPHTCPWCKFERGEITQEELDEIFEDW